MIVKILSSASSDFHGVKYNDKKRKSGAGELMLMQNFPDGIDEKSKQKEVRNYFKAISKSDKVKKPQFHATISTKFQNHSKEELTEIGKHFMKEMGYENQPYIIVFHNDTENNHIHLVSTRVDKTTGKKMDDSFEKLKSQRALQKVLAELQGVDLDKELENDTAFDILKNGVKQKTIFDNQIVFSSKSDSKRANQIKAFLNKYKEVYSNKVFKVIDNREAEGIEDDQTKRNATPKIEFESELQHKMREMFGIDIVFHHKDGQQPFGYSLIDHKTQKVFKGSEIMKMNEIFDFTKEKLDKRIFEQIKDYNVFNAQYKKELLNYFHHHSKNDEARGIKEFMIFENKNQKDMGEYKKVREETFQVIRHSKPNTDISIFEGEDGKHYITHKQYHHIHELESLVGQTPYQNFINPQTEQVSTKNIQDNKLSKVINEFLFEIMKSSGKGLDPAEEERKRKRKKRR